MEQKRFLLAIVLSGVILLTWNLIMRRYLPSPPTENQPAVTASPSPTATPATLEPVNQIAPNVISEAPRREIVVQTPLYRATFDTQGAVAKSWIITTNKKNGRELFSVGGTLQQRIPLELIPQRPDLPARPLQIVTQDAYVTAALSGSNYVVEGADNDVINVSNSNSSNSLTFRLPANEAGLSVTKTIEFNPDSYIVNFKTTVTRNNAPVADARVVIGPSIGDQGIEHYTFYSVAPEAIAVINGNQTERHLAATIESDNQNKLVLSGDVSWAGVGDTYFAMAAVPLDTVQNVEYTTAKYAHQANDGSQDRHFVAAQVPVSASGYALYVGPKDHDLLEAASGIIQQKYNRTVNLDALIDYGFGHQISRPIAIVFLKILENLYAFTANYGIAIILLTLIIYTIFFPLKWRSTKSMKKAQKFAPRMKEIQEQLKKLKPEDPRIKELQMEQLRLFKEGNMLGGCLPMLIQMPFFFAIFRAITISIDFRQAQFLWLKDLSAGDPIHLLPFLMAGSMLVVQMITPAPQADPMQRRLMLIMMPAMMLYFLWSAPAGLLLYWFTGNVILFLQQLVINRLLKKSDGEDLPAGKAAQPA